MLHINWLHEQLKHGLLLVPWQLILKEVMKKGTEGVMPSEREVFSLSGPVHLTAVDW